MLSKQHKFIFVHVSRTGGSSFERMAGAGLTSQDSTKHLGNTDFAEKHKDFAYYMEKYPEEFKTYFKFTIVRNPYERMVSRWFWRTKVVKNVDEIDLTTFIRRYPGKQFAKKFTLPGLSVQESIRQFDYVGRYEDIAGTYDFLGKKLNLSHRPVPHTNKTHHRQYQDYYTKESKQLVREIYEEDIELFDYNF